MVLNNINEHRTTPKAVHKYEVVKPVDKTRLAGERFHFIGAGGTGMSGLAKILLKQKAAVTGSDLKQNKLTENLDRLGADIKIGHNPANLPEKTDAVIISAAVKPDNPELKATRRRGLKIYKYAQALGLLCNCYNTIAISGTHGKSTTSGWLSYCLKQAGLQPSFIIGADIIQLQSSSEAGAGDLFVAEACEYDRSFLNLKPQIACILNIEPDHLDCYKNISEIKQAFYEFACGIKPVGLIIANNNDANTAELVKKLPNNLRYQTFGTDKNCTFSAQNIQLTDGIYAFEIHRNGKYIGKTKILLPGEYNIFNALAVVASAVNAGLEPEQILEHLGSFTGVDRRLMLKEKISGITILDDFAHHPTEIKASLKAVREKYKPRKLWCVFQPHQYSRTRFLLDDFAESFKLADVTVVPQIYFVRDSELSKKQINSEILVEKINAEKSRALFMDGFGPICEYLKANVTAGDVVVTMGAGDIWKLTDEYIRWLRKNR